VIYRILKGRRKTMEKKAFNHPIMKKGKAQVYEVVCKKAACSGSSTHTATTYKTTTVVTSKKAA
jgi:hypothetical protein